MLLRCKKKSYLLHASGKILLSADDQCKQLEPRSEPTKLFDTIMVIVKEFFGKVYFEKELNHKQLPSMQTVKEIINP